MAKDQLRWLLNYGLNTIRYEGFHILCWRMLRWGISIFGDLRAISFCRKDLTLPLEEIKAYTDLTVSQATDADIDQLVALFEKRWSGKQKEKLFKIRSIKDTITEQLHKGSICFLGKIGAESVHYNWIFFGRKDYEHYYTQMRDDEALCDDAFTVNEWRGKGIHASVNNHMLHFLQQAGYRTAYTVVLSDNKSSKKALQHLGWNFYGSLIYFSSHVSKKVMMWQIHPPLNPFIPVR